MRERGRKIHIGMEAQRERKEKKIMKEKHTQTEPHLSRVQLSSNRRFRGREPRTRKKLTFNSRAILMS